MAALTSAGSSMSLDDAPSFVEPSVSGMGIRILGTEFTVDMVILAKGLPTLPILVRVEALDGLVEFTFAFVHSSDSEAESESLLLDAERFRLLRDLLSEGAAGCFGIIFFCDVLLMNRRGGEGFEVGTAELESLSLCEHAEQHDVLVELDTSLGFFLLSAVVLLWDFIEGRWDLELAFDVSFGAMDGEVVDADIANFIRSPPVSDLQIKIIVIQRKRFKTHKL